MNTIIGRESEIKQLESVVNSPQAEFLALYGRRRVGKTFLINHLFKDQFAFKMTGVIEGSLSDQFKAFADAMDDYGYAMPEEPKDWMSAFIMLKKAMNKVVTSHERCVIFIDELPDFHRQSRSGSRILGSSHQYTRNQYLDGLSF